MKTTFRLLITTLLSLVMLAGCSKPTSEIPQSQLQPPGEFTPPSTGSSSSSGAQKPSGSLADTLVVDAGRMQFADSNLLVELDGKVEKASDDKAEAVSASWTQIAGPTAFILSPNSLKSLVLMPEVEEKTALVFELKGENQQALTSRDTTTVFVFPQDGARLAWVVSSVFDENSNELVFTIKLNKPAEVTTPIRFFTTTAGWNDSAARDGIDFQGVAEAQPYTVQFAPREQVKQVSLNLNVFDDSSIEGHEFFYLNIEGEISEDGVLKRFKDRAVAVIKDDEWQPTLIDTTTKVNNEGPSNLGPDELPGDDGVVRTHLTWDEGGDEALRLLVVASPCNRLIIGAGSESGDCNGAIWNVENIAGEGSWAKNIVWPERAPKGSYSVLVEHLAGPNTPVDFDLRLFIDGESHWFSGTLDNGETLEVYSYDLEEDVVASSSSSSEASSSTSSTSSFSESSTSSIESSTSSIESSTSSNESSTSSNESSTSSEIESSSSSNESSESSDQSSSDSSSSTAKPQIDLVIQFDDLAESVIADFNLSITGQVSYDPLFPITNLSLVASVSELGELDQISLVAGEDWDPETGLINTTVNLAQALGQIASLDLQLRALDAADRRASSTPFQRVIYRPYVPASVRFIQPLLEEDLYSTYDASLPYALEVNIDGRLALSDLQIAIFANQESVEPILSETLGAEDYDPELDLYFGRIDISGLPPSNNYWVVANLLDSQGQRAGDSFNLSYQPLALPQLALTAPEPGEYFNAPVNIAGSLIIDPRLTAANIFIQVTPLNGEALTPVRLEYSGESFSWLLPSNTPAGTYDINVWAVDEAEQRVDADSVRITFYPASELTVELTEPESIVELFATQAESVSGFVRQSAGLPLNNVTVSITELQSEAIVELAQFDLLNSEFWNVEEQSFNFLFAPQSYDLSEGNYDLFIRAEDIAGNNNSASFSFSYLIPSLPDLVVTAPQSTTYINLVPVAVSAEFDARLTAQLQVQVFEVMPELDVQSLAQLPVAAQTFDLDQSESINFAVDDLASGNYQLQLSLVDSLGQVSDQQVDFSLRRSVLPQVSISQPEQTELPPVFVGPAFAVSGTVGLDSEASLSELSLVIETLDGGFSSEALSLINDWNSESNEFSFQIDPLALELSYGAYEIVIRAIDSFGNEGSARRSFDFAEALAPSVEWITPPQQSYNELQNIDLLAQFTWEPQLTASAWVQLQALNSESAPELLDLNLTADGSTEIQLANLVPGSYEIVLVIEDELGQQATSPAFSFEIYSALAPQIQFLSPELNEGSYSAYQNEVQLQAQINLGRDAQLQSLSLNLYNGEQLIFTQDLLAAEAFDVETGLMNYRLVVENYADYRVELEAEDSFNLAGQFNFDFSYLEAEPATIALTNPISGASFYELPIISGEFSSDTALPEPNILASLLISDGESNDSIELVPVINQGMFTLDLSQALPAQIESGAVAFSVAVSIRDAQGHQDSDQASYQLLAAPPVVINWLTPSSVEEVFESTSAVVALDISVEQDTSVTLSQLKAWIYDGEQSLGEVNLLEEGAWAEDKSSLSFELNFNQLELDGGEYLVYIEAQTAFGQYQSETLNLRYIDEASLNISVIQPEQGALYLNDVDIAGSIASSEFLRAVSGQASFEPLITDDLDQVAALAVIDGDFVELAIDGNSFSGAIPQQQLSDGRYRLSITLYDQFDRPSNTVVREFDYIRPALTVDLVHDYEVGEGGIELISDLQFTALLNFSHFSLEPQQFILQILDGNTWLNWQAFSPEQVAWNGESANFNLSLEGLEFGPVIMRVLVDYASRNQGNIYQGSSDELGLYYRDVQSPSITWMNAPEGRYPSAQSISFSATTTVDVALSLSPRVVMTTNGEQSEILDYVFEDGVISGGLPAPLAIGQYQLQIFVEDGMQQQASTTPAEFEVYLAEGIQIDLLSPQLSEGVYSSVKPGLNLRAKIFHDPAAQLSGLELKVVGFSEGEFELDSFNLLESESFNPETGELDLTLDIRDYEINSGNFELRLSAQDNFANQSSWAFGWWVRQAQAPIIEFTQPQASFYLSPPTIEGNYQLDPELVVETLQVEMAQLDNEIIVYQGLASEFNQGSFTAALGELANGTYDLRVSLIDDLGQQANDEVQFQFNELSSVQLVLTDPQTEGEQPAFVSLYGDFDFAGVASLDPSLNFETLELVVSAMGAGEEAVVEDVVNLDLIASEIYLGSAQTFRANISLDQWQLPAGQYQLQLRAIVAGQSFSSNSLNVEYIDPIQPSVTIESPIQGQIFYGDIGFTALASVDPRSDFMVSAQLLDANGGVVSAMPVVQQDLDKIEGVFLAASLFSGSYQLSLSITDDFGQVSEPVIVPLRYVIPGGRIDLLHDYPLNDQEQIEVVEPLFIQAQVELNDASLNVVGFDLELFVDGQWQLLESFQEPVAELDWDGENAYFAIDLNDYEISYGAYQLRISLTSNANTRLSSDPVLILYRALQDIELEILNPQQGSYFRPINIEVRASGDPLIALDLTATLSGANSSAGSVKIDLVASEGGDIFTASPDLDPGAYVLEVEARYPRRDQSQFDQVSFNFINPEVGIEVVHQLPVVDDAIDTLGLLELGLVLSILPSDLIIESFELEAKINDVWTSLETYDLLAANFFDNTNASLMLDLREVSIESSDAVLMYSLLNMRAKVNYEGQGVATSPEFLVNFRPAQAVNINITSPQNGDQSTAGFFVNFDYAIDPLLTPVQVVAQVLHADGSSLLLDQIPVLEAPAGTLGFELGADELHWGANQIVLTATDASGAQARAERSVSYLLNAPQVELINPNDGFDFSSDFSLELNFGLDTKMPLAAEEAEIIVQIDEQTIERNVSLLAESGGYSIEFYPSDFTEGFHRIGVLVVDPRNQDLIGEDTLDINFNFAPELEILQPSSDEDVTYLRAVPVQFEVNHPAQLGLSDIKVWINQQALDLSLTPQLGTGRFTIPTDVLIADSVNTLSMQATAINGLSSGVVSEQFLYRQPQELSVAFTQPEPVNNEWFLESVSASIELRAQVQGEGSASTSIPELSIQQVDGRSADYQGEVLIDELTGEYIYKLDMNELDFAYGDFELYLTVADSLDRTAQSDVLSLLYRPLQTPQLIMLEPDSEVVNSDSDVNVVISYSLDPLAGSAQLVGSIINGNQEVFEFLNSFVSGSDQLSFPMDADVLTIGTNIVSFSLLDGLDSELSVSTQINFLPLQPEVKVLVPGEEGLLPNADPRVLLNINFDSSKLPVVNPVESLPIAGSLNGQSFEGQLLAVDQSPDGEQLYALNLNTDLLWETFSQDADFSNFLSFSVSDPRSAEASVDVSVAFNYNHKPIIELNTPQAGEIPSVVGDYRAYFTVKSGLGAPVPASNIEIQRNGEVITASIIQSEVGYEALIPAEQMIEGEQTFTLIATSVNGVSSEPVRFNLSYRTPDELGVTFTKPEPVNSEWFLETVSASIELRAIVQKDDFTTTDIPQLSIQQVDGRSDVYQGEVLIDEITGEYIYKLNMNELDFGYGNFELYLSVADSLGRNARSDSLTLVYRSIKEPQLTIVEPELDSLITSSEIEVTVEYSQDELAGSAQLMGYIKNNNEQNVEIFNELVLGTDKLSFTLGSEILSYGENSLIFTLSDSSSTPLTDTKIINFVRSEALSVTINQPELEQSYIGGYVELSGIVEFEEAFPLTSLVATISNRNNSQVYIIDNDILANGGSKGSTYYFSGRYNISSLDLNSSIYPLEIKVVAQDQLERVGDDLVSFEYRIPQATSVNIIRPAPNSEQVNGLEIAADVFKDEGLEVQVRAEIKPIDPGSNQQELTLDMQLTSVPDLGPAYFTSLAAGQLLPGEYLLSVVAKDSLDREERAETRFTYRDLRAPEVEFIGRGFLVGSSPLEIDLDINLDAALPLDQLNLEAIYTTQGTQTFPVAAIAIGETYAPLVQIDGSRYRMAVDQAMLYDGTTQYTLRVCDPRAAGLCSDNIQFLTTYQLPELRLLNYGGEGAYLLAGQFVAEYQLDPYVSGANLTAQIYYADGSIHNIDILPVEDGAEERFSAFYISDSQLRQGSNRIVVSLDDGRNQVQAEWSKDFELPIVQISYPKQNQQMQGDALLEFTVEYTGVDGPLDYAADLILSLDGVVYNDLEALPNSSGQYVFDLTQLELTDGDHNLSLQVRDFRNASVISEPTSRSFNYRNALPELNFNFQPPFFDNNEFLFLLKHNPDVPLINVSLLLAGEELSDIGIDNLDTASGEIPFALPFNTLRNQALVSSEVGLGNFPITLIAEFEGGFTESAELNFEWGDETAQPVKVPSLVANLFGYSFVWGGSEEHNIYLTYKDFSENQSFNIEESQGNSDYFFNFESLSTTILPNLDQANQARQRVVFGPDVRPADVLLALVNESDLSFHLTRSQDLYDIPSENFDHKVLNFAKQPTALDAMVFADGTVWDSEEILRRADTNIELAQFTFAMSIGGHTINREGNATFNFGNPNPSTANFTNRKLLVDGVDVQASTVGNLNYPFDKLQALLGDKEQSRIVELTLEASNDGLYSRDTGVLFLYRGDARYPIANETREVVAFNMGEQGQVSAVSAGDMTFDAGFEGAKTFLATGENRRFYFRDKKAVDTIRLPSPDLPVPNFRYGSFGFSFEIQPDDVEFFRPQNSNDLYVSHVSRNPAMWQIVTSFFSYQKVPLYRLHYFQGPSPTPTFNYDAKPAYWTIWYNRDESSGNGDYELIDQIGLDCRPVAMEARLVKGEVIYVPGADTPDVLQNFDVKSGLACANDDQVDGECGDYEVRFLCEGQDTQSLSFN